jgi:hypothetical protein
VQVAPPPPRALASRNIVSPPARAAAVRVYIHDGEVMARTPTHEIGL